MCCSCFHKQVCPLLYPSQRTACLVCQRNLPKLWFEQMPTVAEALAVAPAEKPRREDLIFVEEVVSLWLICFL